MCHLTSQHIAFITGTPIVGRPIKELHEHLPKTHMRIVAVYRNAQAIPAYGDTSIGIARLENNLS
jgi:trk system potassium uptake protein TrkA